MNKHFNNLASKYDTSYLIATEENPGYFADFMIEIESLHAAKEAIENARIDSTATIKAGLGKTAEGRAALAIQFRPITPSDEFKGLLWSLITAAADTARSCGERGLAAKMIQKLGFDLGTFAGHPFATHCLVSTNTGRDYFLRLHCAD